MPDMPGAATKIDIADMPVQRAENPADAAGARARYFNSGNAFNIKLPVVPACVFTDAPAKALAADPPTGFVACDQATAMECSFPATTPLMLARYATIAAGETLVSEFRATGSIWYVIAGSGASRIGGETLRWSAGDVFLLPGGGPVGQAAAERAVLWTVSNEPQLAVDGARCRPLRRKASSKRCITPPPRSNGRSHGSTKRPPTRPPPALR